MNLFPVNHKVKQSYMQKSRSITIRTFYNSSILISSRPLSERQANKFNRFFYHSYHTSKSNILPKINNLKSTNKTMTRLTLFLLKYPIISSLLLIIFIKISFFESVAYCEGWSPIPMTQGEELAVKLLKEQKEQAANLLIEENRKNVILELKERSLKNEKERILREGLENLKNAVRLDGESKYIKLDLLIKNSKFGQIDVILQNLVKNVNALKLQINYNENCQFSDPRSTLLIDEIKRSNLPLSDPNIRSQFNYLLQQTKNPVLVQLYTAYMSVSIAEFERDMTIAERTQHYRLDQIFIRKTYIDSVK